MRQFVKLPSVNNVAPGNTATIRLPIGPTYEKLIMETNIAPDLLRYLEVIVNGKTVQTYQSVAELNALNRYYGREDQPGFATLYFIRPELAELAMSRITAFGTADVSSLEIRVDISPEAENPKLAMHAVTSPAQPLGLITKVKAFPVSSAVAGEIEIDNIPRGPRIIAMHVFGGQIEYSRVEVDSAKAVEHSTAAAEVWQEQWGRNPLEGGISIDFCLDRDISQALVTEGAQDLRFIYRLQKEGALRQVVEYLDALPGI